MPLKLYIEAGGEWLLPFAKKTLRDMKAGMARQGRTLGNKWIPVEPSGEQIYIQSQSIGFGQALDTIRITVPARGTLFELLDPTQLMTTDPHVIEAQAEFDAALAVVISGVAAFGGDYAAYFSTPEGAAALDAFSAAVDALAAAQALYPDKPLVDAALLDPSSDNYGFVLPKDCEKKDTAFNTALLVNPSFAKQLPEKYPDISHYLYGFVEHPWVIRRTGQQFVYLPDVGNGTLVSVNPFVNYGDGSIFIDQLTTICWVDNIKKKAGSPEFATYIKPDTPALPAETDFGFGINSQASQPAPAILAMITPLNAVGSDAVVTLPVHRAGATDAMAFTKGVASPEVKVTIALPAGYEHRGGAVARHGSTHYLLTGSGDYIGPGGNANAHIALTSSAGEVFFSEIVSSASNSGATGVGLKVTH